MRSRQSTPNTFGGCDAAKAGMAVEQRIVLLREIEEGGRDRQRDHDRIDAGGAHRDHADQRGNDAGDEDRRPGRRPTTASRGRARRCRWGRGWRPHSRRRRRRSAARARPCRHSPPSTISDSAIMPRISVCAPSLERRRRGRRRAETGPARRASARGRRRELGRDDIAGRARRAADRRAACAHCP